MINLYQILFIIDGKTEIFFKASPYLRALRVGKDRTKIKAIRKLQHKLRACAKIIPPRRDRIGAQI
jgi:hypothetical protein